MRVRLAPQGTNTMDVTIKDAAVVVDGQVSEDGRIYGLKKYAGRTVKVVVLEEKKEKP
ncbi:MAG: hypothetical protein A4E31_00293 [Methanomassiliicoccales archaeon PtaU1.Bin030]|nr:MAG: hypothetical protein A4E31_00293 [Methanomassiliicoccales archaeon PtaU1.Bin030]